MNILPNDIRDDEIRIISSEKKDNKGRQPETYKKIPVAKKFPRFSHNNEDFTPKPKWKLWLVISVILFIGALCVFFWWEIRRDTLPEEKEHLQIKISKAERKNVIIETADNLKIPVPTQNLEEKGFVEYFDTVINKEKFTIFKPQNLTPELRVGVETLRDSIPKFVVQAADIRKDNGGIVGAYIYKGNLVSKGQAKAGFCAIINGKPIIGVAETTPYLEEAIENDGFFFRQYPLVMEGQPVNNKLKSSSLRKTLAEINGEIVVIMSHDRMTLNDFSQHLVDLGAKNAIYLVGSSSFGFAIDKEGNKIEFGKEKENPSINTNYIIWQ